MKQRCKRIQQLFAYALSLLKTEGVIRLLRRALGFFRRRFFGKKARYLPCKKVLRQQRSTPLQAPTISVCVPLYNTPKKYLQQFLAAMQAQTSGSWQLCLADASDENHAYVGQLVQAQNDERILYKAVPNRSIAENTNAAAALATGEYIALADHDDILAPHAIFCLQQAICKTGAGFLYSDEALFKTDIRKAYVAHCKPSFAYEYLLCCNYICHLAAFRRSLFWQLGGLRKQCDGSQDHDLFLRLAEQLSPAEILHIPQVLYYWRVHQNSTSGGVGAKPYVQAAAKKAIADHLARTGQNGTVHSGLFPSTYKVDFAIEGEPLVSILIPNKDHTQDLETCLQSVYTKTQWRNFEVVVIENNSTLPQTQQYYQTLQQRYPNLTLVHYQGGFNFSAINNFGRRAANGDYLLLLNNDVEVINPDWLTQMLMQASRPGVGICGAMLYYPDDTIQHAGVITGLGGFAGHSHKYKKRQGSGYMFRTSTVQNFSAVTAACLLVKSEVYDAVGGLDEAFAVAFNDVDFCLRVRNAGWRIVFTPYAQLYHYESKSRGQDEKDAAKKQRFAGEQQRLLARFGKQGLQNDPFYNPNLTLDREDFSESDDLRRLKECQLL